MSLPSPTTTLSSLGKKRLGVREQPRVTWLQSGELGPDSGPVTPATVMGFLQLARQSQGTCCHTTPSGWGCRTRP